jgi:hypothetical protein
VFWAEARHRVDDPARHVDIGDVDQVPDHRTRRPSDVIR